MSMRAIAKELGVSRGSLGRILKDDEETCKVSQVCILLNLSLIFCIE